MEVQYTVSYIKQQSSGGFSFFGLFRSNERTKCAKCKNHAVMNIKKKDNPDVEIDLCVECYNFYSIPNLLDYIEHGPRAV